MDVLPFCLAQARVRELKWSPKSSGGVSESDNIGLLSLQAHLELKGQYDIAAKIKENCIPRGVV